MAGPEGKIRIANCACGVVALEAAGEPIIGAACYCTSCRTAGQRLEALPGAPPILQADHGTEFALYRKDRVRCLRGGEHLREFRLTPSSPTRRVVATCCNTAMFLEFKGGHWLSLYRLRLPPEDRPPVELRTMTKDLGKSAAFTDGLPSYRTQSVGFMWRLFCAWAAMGFRAPKVDYVEGGIDAGGG